MGEIASISSTGRILSGRLWFTEILSHFLYNYTIPGRYGDETTGRSNEVTRENGAD